MTQRTDWGAWNIKTMENEIMDYEKKYNEALEWMREIYPTMEGFVKEDAEHYFPELKENEDEKIRTRLIALVEAFGQGKYKDEMLAYLEKQKEPRDYRKLYEEVVKSDWFKENYVGKSLGEGHQPAEWSEEDDNMLQAIIKRYEFAVESDCAVFIKTERLTQMEKELDWLKSLHPQSHWKPSEEQMDIMKEAVAFFGNSWVSRKQKVLESLYEDLKKL